jgi:hypothetical protein
LIFSFDRILLRQFSPPVETLLHFILLCDLWRRSEEM